MELNEKEAAYKLSFRYRKGTPFPVTITILENSCLVKIRSSSNLWKTASFSTTRTKSASTSKSRSGTSWKITMKMKIGLDELSRDPKEGKIPGNKF